MRKNNNTKKKTIKVKNKLPELLEAVCYHEDCPYWLKTAIYDAVADQNHYIVFTAKHFRASFESMNRELGLDEPETLDAEVIQ